MRFSIYINIADIEMRARLGAHPGPLLERFQDEKRAAWHTAQAQVLCEEAGAQQVRITIIVRADALDDPKPSTDALDEASATQLGIDLAVLFSGPNDDVY